MNGNIIGEPFDPFVQLQIEARQSNQFGGYRTSLRTNDQIQYLNNRNAWVKLASSVDILEGDVLTPIPPASSGFQGGSSPLPGQSGFLGNTSTFNTSPSSGPIPGLSNVQTKTYKSDKLRNIGIEDPENYPGSKLSEKAILFNTLSSFDPIKKAYSYREGVTNDNLNPQGKINLWNNFAYGLGGTDFGIQPPPGIIGVTVDSINRGSIRKASVTLKAHNKFQFDIIELLYLRLGFTMMLEWGWDRYLDNETGTIQQVGNTIIEEKWFTSKDIPQLEMLGYIQEKREEYDGNYDGFFGKVSNFTWSFNPDGSYDISIDLITIGDVIESIKVNTSNKQQLKTTSTENLNLPINQITTLKDTSIEKAATLNTIGSFLYQKIGEMSTAGGSLLSANDTLDYLSLLPSLPPKQISGGYGNNLGISPVSNSGQVKFDPNSIQKYSSYVRLGEFLFQLESLIIPKVQNDGKTPYPQITFEKFNTRITYFPNQISLDPKVCIFKPSLNSYGDNITGVSNPSYLNSLANYYMTMGNRSYGLLMNLYLNINFISDLLITNGGPDQELSLFKFLQDLCNGVNNALGGVNKLEPVIKDDYKITIIDQTLAVPEEDNTVNLEIYGYNTSTTNPTSNFVKDIKFVSKITPQLASMISIGATAAGTNTSETDGTAFSKWSEGLVDRFSKEILEPNYIPSSNAQTLPDEKFYRDKFSKYDDYAAPVSTNSTVYKVINALSNFISDIFEEDSNTPKTPSPASPELRIIKDSKYPTLYGDILSFNQFYSKARAIDKELEAINAFTSEEIKERVGSNYAIYLLQSFGGTSGEIKIVYPYSTKPPQPYTYSGDPRYLEYNDTFISQGKSAYQIYIKNLNNEIYKNDKTPSNEIGFIPLSFDLILEGISGIKIYNKLNINNTFLPSNYPESLNFIITKVNHNISNNSWDTSLSTISMPKTQPYKFTSTPTLTGSTINNIESTFRTDPKLLTVSENLINFLKREEAFRDKAYDDAKPKTKLTATTPITGTLTVGYGFTNAVVPKYIVKPIVWNTTITRDVADRVLVRILKESPSQTVKNNITVPLTQYEFDALVSIVYNVGNINDSNLVKLKTTLNNKDYQTAASLISQYKTTSKGIFNAGLANRRKKEQQIFISGTY
jgi:GH24 family phage-related lysozyme (muramidase)